MSENNTVRKDIGEDLNYSAIWEIGIVFALFCIVITVYLYGLYLRVDQAENYRKQVESIDPAIAEAVQDQINKINTFGWSASETGKVSIPIDQSMQETAQRLAAERSQPAPGGVPDETSVEVEPGSEDPDAAEGSSN